MLIKLRKASINPKGCYLLFQINSGKTLTLTFIARCWVLKVRARTDTDLPASFRARSEHYRCRIPLSTWGLV